MPLEFKHSCLPLPCKVLLHGGTFALFKQQFIVLTEHFEHITFFFFTLELSAFRLCLEPLNTNMWYAETAQLCESHSHRTTPGSS